MARTLHHLASVKDVGDTTLRHGAPDPPQSLHAGSFLARIFTGSSYPYALRDEVGFLNRRVRLFLGILFWFFALFAVGVVVKGFAFGREPEMARAAWIATAVMSGMTLVFGLSWLRHRDPCSCSRASIELSEAVGTVLASTAIGCIVLALPTGLPVWNLLLTVVLTLVLRAAVVPSTAARTVAVGLLSTVGMTTPVWFYLADAPDRFERLVWTAVGTWGLIFTVATAIVSRVIYGLHASVRRAMRLGRYTLEHKIGEGGMGVVYLARHALLRRPTAVKVLRPGRDGDASIRRFEREVQQTSQLEHPNIVVIYDYGRTAEGQFYYAMEYLDGLTLAELVERDGPLPPGRVVYVLAQVAHALAAAHARGLIHRDVKPANIVLCNRGGIADLAKVVDFGLVQDVERAPGESVADSITGTPLYMAPESLTEPTLVDARTDLYALGAVGYFLLTGEHVFSGRSVVEICAHHLHTEPEHPAKRLGAQLPDDLVSVVLRCLAKNPADRFGDALSLRRALLACRAAETWSMDDALEWWRDSDAAQVSASRRWQPVEPLEPPLGLAPTQRGDRPAARAP